MTSPRGRIERPSRSASVTTRALFGGFLSYAVSFACVSGGHSGLAAPPASVVLEPLARRRCEVALGQRARVPALLAEGRLDRAVRVIERADELCPTTEADTWDALVTALAELGRDEEARTVADAIDARAAAGSAVRAAARKARETIAARDGASFDGKTKASMTRTFEAAAGALHRNQHLEAKRGFLEAWSQHRPNGEALVWAGIAAKRMGEAAEAQRLFDRAMVELARATGKGVIVAVPEDFPFGSKELILGPAQLAWSRDGRFIAVVRGHVVSIRDRFLGWRETARLEGHTRWLTAVVFSSDGTSVASSSADGTVRLWNVATGLEAKTFKGHTEGVAFIAMSPDGQLLASTGDDRTLRVWSTATGAETRKLDIDGSLGTLAFSPDGTSLAVGATSWSTSTWTKTRRFIPSVLAEDMRAVAFSPDGSLLALSDESVVRLFEVTTGAETRRLRGGLHHVDSLVFSADGKTLASSSSSAVRLWDVATGNEIRQFDDGSTVPGAIGLSPDGKTVAIPSAYDTVELWDVASGAATGKLEWLDRRGSGTTALAFSRDGRSLALSSHEGALRLWGGAGIKTLPRANGTGPLRDIAFSPDGHTVATSDWSKDVHLWSLAAEAQVATLRGHTAGVTSVAFSPDGKTVASSSNDKTIRVWDVATATETRELAGHTGDVGSVAFSPDGNTLVSGSNDKTVRLWDATAGVEKRRLEGHREQVFSVRFSPDGETVVSTSGDGFRVWNAATGAEMRKSSAAMSPPVSLSPEGTLLAGGSAGTNALHLWNVTEMTHTGALPWREPSGFTAMSLAFTADGNTLASSSSEDATRLWTRTGDPLLLLFDVQEKDRDGGYAVLPGAAPLVELFGLDADVASDYLYCRTGGLRFPLALCRERFQVRGLFAGALSGDASYADP